MPDPTIEALARSFFRESAHYGFERLDYIRFVNILLDMTTRNSVDAPLRREQTHAPGGNGGECGVIRPTLPLKGEQVSIRAFEHDDLRFFHKWLQDIHGRHFLVSRTTSRESDIRDVVQSRYNIIAIITLPDKTPVGAIAFLDHDTVQHKAELRKLIGDQTWRGRGLAKEASRLWIEYGLSTLGLKKIYLNTLGTNLPNIRLNEALGFQVEGILRNEVLLDGRYHDVLRMGLWCDT